MVFSRIELEPLCFHGVGTNYTTRPRYIACQSILYMKCGRMAKFHFTSRAARLEFFPPPMSEVHLNSRPAAPANDKYKFKSIFFTWNAPDEDNTFQWCLDHSNYLKDALQRF